MDGVAAGRLGMGGAGEACAGEWTGVVTGGGVPRCWAWACSIEVTRSVL